MQPECLARGTRQADQTRLSALLPLTFSPEGSRIASASDDSTLRIWDAASGVAVSFRVQMLGKGDFVPMTPDGKRIIQVSPGAWRDLGWLVPDATGALTRYRAEVFGPLPEYRENRTPPQ